MLLIKQIYMLISMLISIQICFDVVWRNNNIVTYYALLINQTTTKEADHINVQ